MPEGDVGYEMTLTANGREVGKAVDVEIVFGATEVSTNVRDSGGWKRFIQGLKEWTSTIDQLWVPTNTGLRVLRDAYFDGSEVAVEFRDQDGNGFDGAAVVVGLSRNGPLDGAVMFNARLASGVGAAVIVEASTIDFMVGGSNNAISEELQRLIAAGDM